MKTQSEIRFNLAGLEEMQAELSARYVTRVGILGGAGMHQETETITVGNKTYTKKTGTDSAMSNAEIGTIHEFGSVSANIPPRSFLRMPIETKRDDVIKAMTGSTVRRAFEARQFRKIFSLLGVAAENIVQDAFSTGGFGKWPALKASTVRAKGSSAPLINSGQLRKSVTSDVVKSSR